MGASEFSPGQRHGREDQVALGWLSDQAPLDLPFLNLEPFSKQRRECAAFRLGST